MEVILLPVMVAALQGHLYAHAWGTSCQRSSRLLSYPFIRPSGLPRSRFLLSSVPPPKDEQEEEGGSQGPVLAKGDHHHLPRLYVGSEPAIYRIQGPLRGSDLLAPPQPSSSQPSPLASNVRLQLSDYQSHYLTTVLRLLKKNKKRKPADPLLRVFDGQSGEWLARVVDENDDQVEEYREALEDANAPAPSKKKSKRGKHRPLLSVECLSLLRSQTAVTGGGGEARPSRWSQAVWLCVAVPASKDRFRWLLEKATELNVDVIVPIETEHSSSSSGHDKGSRISPQKALAYLLEASEQSERLSVPRLTHVSGSAAAASATHDEPDPSSLPTTKLVDLLDGTSSSQNFKFIVCRERAGDSPSFIQALGEVCCTLSASVPENIAFCIGPEGGWSPSEESLMDELEAKFPSAVANVSLGPTVLRMETAAISALSAYNVFCDDLHRRSSDGG